MRLKSYLRTGKVSIGSWITTGHPAIAEIMAKSGFDWLAIDMEHSAITLYQAFQLTQVISLTGVTTLVRVSKNDHNTIKQVMDMGVDGVIVPMVNTERDAFNAVSAVKYPPEGNRGVGLARAQGYGLEFEKYRSRVNKDSIVVVQIEHIEAIENLEKILSVKGVDASIVGPYDLSASLGYPGEFDKKIVKEAIARYLKICNSLNKPVGFHVIGPEAEKVNNKIKEGFRFIGFSLDTLFLGEKIRNELKELRTKK